MKQVLIIHDLNGSASGVNSRSIVIPQPGVILMVQFACAWTVTDPSQATPNVYKFYDLLSINAATNFSFSNSGAVTDNAVIAGVQDSRTQATANQQIGGQMNLAIPMRYPIHRRQTLYHISAIFGTANLQADIMIHIEF